jgi:hypothetical protein
MAPMSGLLGRSMLLSFHRPSCAEDANDERVGDCLICSPISCLDLPKEMLEKPHGSIGVNLETLHSSVEVLIRSGDELDINIKGFTDMFFLDVNLDQLSTWSLVIQI